MCVFFDAEIENSLSMQRLKMMWMPLPTKHIKTGGAEEIKMLTCAVSEALGRSDQSRDDCKLQAAKRLVILKAKRMTLLK